MNTRAKTWIWATTAALLLVGTALLYAQTNPEHRDQWGQGRGHGLRERGFMGKMAEYLQLTDAQKEQIKTMWQAEKPNIQPLMQQLAEGRKQMLAATANGNFDQARVAAIANQQSQTLAQLIVEKEKLQSQIYNQVLTPEQRNKADQLRQKHADRMDRWLQRMASPPGD